MSCDTNVLSSRFPNFIHSSPFHTYIRNPRCPLDLCHSVLICNIFKQNALQKVCSKLFYLIVVSCYMFSWDDKTAICNWTNIGLNFISFVYQYMSNYIYLQTYVIYKTGFRRKSVDLFESVSHLFESVSQLIWVCIPTYSSLYPKLFESV